MKRIKVIDDQGRLFRKINVIDFLIILFFLSIILPMCYFSYKIIIKKPPIEPPIDKNQ